MEYELTIQLAQIQQKLDLLLKLDDIIGIDQYGQPIYDENTQQETEEPPNKIKKHKPTE